MFEVIMVVISLIGLNQLYEIADIASRILDELRA